MKRNTKILLMSLSLLSATSVAAPVVTPAVSQPVIAAEATNSAQTISMTITKTGSNAPSEAAMFLGNKAQVTVVNGKITEVKIHIDGSNSPRTKGQNMAKMISSLTLNGVNGKQENVAQDGSSLDFVFPASAYKDGKGSIAFGLNVMGRTMNEKADVVLGNVTTTTITKKAKKTHKVKRTLKHNAYIYKRNGKRANHRTLRKGHRVSTYGRAIKLHGKYFYHISKSTYVKRANFR